ncbi:MAG TPA: type II secretion system major pseudopilin GspG [Pirellulaceae bacterium]|nr:type II secretion system major pseudopilin GspG [Pirellulaceae bacterium]
MRKQRDRRAAFTLMEVLLVLVILVILGGIVGVSISQTRKKGLTGTAKVQLSALKGPLENYSTDNGRYPSSQQGLSALRQAPSDLANPQKWQGPYTEAEVGLDPWGNPYQYESDGSSYRVWSWGPNGVNDQGGNDDILIEGQ